jgi:hypothetical protein
MKIVPLSLICLIILASCGRVEQDNEHEATMTDEEEEEMTLRIDAGGVGDFRLGESMPAGTIAGFDVRQEVELTEAEGEQYEIPWYIVSFKGEDLLRLRPAYDYASDGFGDMITEILITSPRCQTAEGAGVGAAVEEVAALYRSLAFWYTYVSDMFVAETPQLPGVQFILDARGFIGARDDLMDSDMVVLARKDFRPATRVRGMRLVGGEE